MTAVTTIREKLHTYIDEAPLDKIEALFVLLKDEIGIRYNQGMLAELYERRKRHQDNQSKSFSVEESMQAIRNQPKS